MPITDYKVTDVERNAVYVQAQADTLTGTADQNKAVFDAYPELVRDNLDGLCDFIATAPITYTSSAAAATANKGSITGFVPLGAVIELSMTNGNTAAAPTIAIDGETYTISGMPTTAQVQANSTQTYRLVKTAATTLTFTKNPDYVCEYGTASGVIYRLYASGQGDSTPTHAKLVGSVASFQALTQTAATYINWNTASAVGSTITAAANTGLITCNFNGYIQASGNMLFQGCTVGDAIIIDLVVGGSIVNTYYTNAPVATYFNIAIPATIVAVTSGQTVLLQARNGTAARGNMGNNSSSAVFGPMLTVIKV